MAKKKRPGVRAAPSVRSSSDSVASGGFGRGESTRRGGMGDRGKSTRSGISTRSGLSTVGGGRSTHTTRSTSDWGDDDNNNDTKYEDKRPGIAQGTQKSVRELMKRAGSVGSGLGLSSHSGHKITHKQRKARPGLAVAPQGMSQRSNMTNNTSAGRSKYSRSGSNSGFSSNAGSGGGGGGGGSLSPPSTHHQNRPMKKQMSTRSMGTNKSSAHSVRSRNSRNGTAAAAAGTSSSRTKSVRSIQSAATGAGARSMHSKKSGHSRHSGYDHDDNDDYDEFHEENGDYENNDYYENNHDDYDDYDDADHHQQEETIVMPQTEEEIRKGLHTEQVTKGFFRKKVRSIKWYSADIDKVDAGKFEAQETIREEDADGANEGDNSSSGEYEADSDDESEVVVPDPWYTALGRGLLLLEKKGEETTPIKRWLRFLTWLTFLCDATSAIVTLAQFSEITYCCGKPILNIGNINADWAVIIRYATIFYLILILLEVYPVLRRGFPFNIVNPIIGFLITFALFFDDSYVEALIMWCIETAAVLSEFAVYRVKIRQVNMRSAEIKTLMPKTTKKKESFEDEDLYLRDLHKARRRYYVLKQEQRMDQRLLQYLHIAVYMNIIISSVVLMLILVVARNGGLCIANFDVPNPFAGDQLSSCTMCGGSAETGEVCEYCSPETETFQCYYPYS